LIPRLADLRTNLVKAKRKDCPFPNVTPDEAKTALVVNVFGRWRGWVCVVDFNPVLGAKQRSHELDVAFQQKALQPYVRNVRVLSIFPKFCTTLLVMSPILAPRIVTLRLVHWGLKGNSRQIGKSFCVSS
jgi:hypothetical protein